MNVKTCPYCGGKEFLAVIERGGIVESIINDKGDPDFKIINENTKSFDVKIIKCKDCKHDLTNEELVEDVTCSKCGRHVSKEDLDENGVCIVCRMISEKPEIENASQDELLRMLAKALQQNSSVNQKIESKIELAEETKEPTERRKIIRKQKDTEQKKDEEKTEEKPDTKKQSEVSVTEVTKRENDIPAETQNAPFPETTSDAGFNMFEEEVAF